MAVVMAVDTDHECGVHVVLAGEGVSVQLLHHLARVHAHTTLHTTHHTSPDRPSLTTGTRQTIRQGL